MACLRCVSKGLEADPCFTWLWLLYLPLYGRHMTAKGGPSDVTKVAETSLTHSKHCYQLWLRVVQLQPDWQRRAVLLQRGLLALAQAQPGDYMGVSEEEAAGWTAMRSACVLDLVLRLLLLWTSVEAHDIVAGWIAELVKLVDQAKARVQSEDGECGTVQICCKHESQARPICTAWFGCFATTSHHVNRTQQQA